MTSEIATPFNGPTSRGADIAEKRVVVFPDLFTRETPAIEWQSKPTRAKTDLMRSFYRKILHKLETSISGLPPSPPALPSHTNVIGNTTRPTTTRPQGTARVSGDWLSWLPSPPPPPSSSPPPPRLTPVSAVLQLDSPPPDRKVPHGYPGTGSQDYPPLLLHPPPCLTPMSAVLQLGSPPPDRKVSHGYPGTGLRPERDFVLLLLTTTTLIPITTIATITMMLTTTMELIPRTN